MAAVKVYVAGPLFGSGRCTENVHKALRVAEAVRAAGAFPFVPHLFTQWDMTFPHADEAYWLDMDKVWLETCQALVVIPGMSPGTRKEEVWAQAAGLHIVGLPATWQEDSVAILAAKLWGTFQGKGLL